MLIGPEPRFPADPGGDSELAPVLSVVVAAYRPGPLLAACLNSLRAQRTAQRFEVIIVLSGDDQLRTVDQPRKGDRPLAAAGDRLQSGVHTGAGDRLQSEVQEGGGERKRQGRKKQATELKPQEYAEFRWVRSPRRMYCGEARNKGIEVARGRIIAFLDADCSVSPDWVDKILEAHEDPHQLIGGTIVNGAPRDPVSWAYYFCEFNLWLPGSLLATEMDEMAGCCLSIKREAFEAFGPFLEGTYCSDSAFQWKLNRAGQRVLVSPSIQVFHTAAYSLRSFFEHVVEHRRCFARVCVSEGRVGRQFAYVWFLTAPFLPFLLLPAISWRVTRAGGLIRPFLRSFPWVIAGCLARALGEVKGVWQAL